MIILEKWQPNKPISVVYFDGERERYYVKRFMIEHPDREEKFITDHPGSKLQIVALDYRPMAEIIYSKRSLENEILNFEEFIAIKGIKALGNQFSTDKIKDVNLLESLPYEAPEVNEVELIDEEIIENTSKISDKENEDPDDEGQTTLF
jgi:topoisomerase-4 subunit A